MSFEILIVLQTIIIIWLLIKRNKKCTKSVSQATDKIANTNEEYKMVLLVRKDLKMQKGKIAAQCGHAAVGCVLKAQKYDPISLNTWRYYGQAKIALVVDNLEQLEQLEKKAEKSNLITKKICDAGRTQVEPGSITVLGIGPAPVSVLDQITGKLKLL
ncbi:peptidyl-tRNA hydrolase 2, mitochondrial precursor, putative [Entamoeba dispar SAW760]|uniref:peptidyl-tRNA hydrolase n=1 Tax=Entamoeba dispar (strain ATCC PRA-260 / SAW760) TaxID=370354 RepID=B0EUT9_ENTDS|nr:peptidyl-tRNA hydrolase 2, mitochondrial precursor, putative [Entamoeba dispar SAW760]EDR21733.1 peptidyl-tRNA hydrolase 2, mitochondrial precursor, putative [Entamoeba dispar SAW760]|eukprot:EDR21733.1 peptidyl-tRNA hydrolase 2, mitochondrial precursor, putative [Entamoeba dispar SAW760]